MEGAKEIEKIKVICLGDSAVGKSKLIERFLMDGYKPQQLSTFALTLFNYNTKVGDRDVTVEFWDTAGQERFDFHYIIQYSGQRGMIPPLKNQSPP